MNFAIAGNSLLNDGEVIANFVPRIRGLYSANPEEPLQLLLEVTREGAPPQTIVWPAEQLDQLNFEKLIVGCISRDARGRSTRNLVATYLRMQLSQCDLPRGQYFDQTGWQQIDGQHRYFPDLAPENRLAEPPLDGSPPYLIAKETSSYHLSVDPTMSAETAVEQLLETFLPHLNVYLPVWAYALFSVCRSFLQDSGLPTACILYLIATQGFGKTATAKALCQLFDDAGGCMADVYDAGSTMSAMERALMTTRDRSVLLDDIYIGTNKAKQRERLASAAALLRFAANETKRTKTRGSKNISVSCAAGLVVTGEIPMEASSDVTRCMIVRIHEKLADSSNPVDLEALRHTAATAMQGFLSWFGERYEEFRSRIKCEMESQLATVKNAPNERVKMSLFELYWLLCRFADYAEEVKAISAVAKSKFLQATAYSLTQVWHNITEELRRIENLPETLREAIVSGVQQQEFYAFRHNGCLCVKLPALTKYLQELYHRSDLSEQYVAKWLNQCKLLSIDASKKSTKKIKGKRYLCIPISSLNPGSL